MKDWCWGLVSSDSSGLAARELFFDFWLEVVGSDESIIVPSKLNRLLLELDDFDPPSNRGFSDSCFFTEGFFFFEFCFKLFVVGDWVDRERRLVFDRSDLSAVRRCCFCFGCCEVEELSLVGFVFEFFTKVEGIESIFFFFFVFFWEATEEDLIERLLLLVVRFVDVDDEDADVVPNMSS